MTPTDGHYWRKRPSFEAQRQQSELISGDSLPSFLIESFGMDSEKLYQGREDLFRPCGPGPVGEVWVFGLEGVEVGIGLPAFEEQLD